jgi:hypothetical protein
LEFDGLIKEKCCGCEARGVIVGDDATQTNMFS